MTTPGPDEFFSCPHCNCILRRRTIASGNTFRQTLWTDTYLDRPMLPPPVETTQCPSCATPFVVEDARNLGEHWTNPRMRDDDDEPLPEGYGTAPYVKHANARALRKLIALTQDSKRLFELRIRLWHLHNHAARAADGQSPVKKPAHFDDNLEQLLRLLKDDRGEDQFLKAEALRELGRHAEAIAMLQDIDPELAWAADPIRALAQANNPRVAILE